MTHQNLFAALLLVNLLPLLPLKAWNKTRALFFPALTAVLVFEVIIWSFVIAQSGVYHDFEHNTQRWTEIVNQWLSWGRPLGWLPYLSGGQPFAIHNNLINLPEILVLSKLFMRWGFHFSETQVFNLGYLFTYYCFLSGAALLFQELFGSRWITFLGFLSLLFGGVFFGDLAQPQAFTVLFAFPWPAFFLLRFLRGKQPESLVLFSFSVSRMINYYIPSYALMIFFLSALLGVVLFWKDLLPLSQWSSSFRYSLMLAMAVVVFIVMALPMVNSYFEIKDYFSPTRGASGIEVQSGDTGLQGVIATKPEQFQALSNAKISSAHGPFYFGLLLLPCAGLALLSRQGFIFLTVAGLAGLFSLGRATPIWEILVSEIPLMSYARHSFHFAPYAAFFILMACLEGVRQASGTKSIWFKAAGLAISTLGLWWIFREGDPGFWSTYRLTTISISVIAILLISRCRVRPRIVGLALLLIIQAIQLSSDLYQNKEYKNNRAPRHNLRAFDYPGFFTFIENRPNLLPFYYYPIEEKSNQWYHDEQENIFLVQKDFHKLIERLWEKRKKLYNAQMSIFHLLPELPEEITHDRVFDLLMSELSKGLQIKREKSDHAFCPEPGLCSLVSDDPNQKTLLLNLLESKTLLRLENYHRHWNAFLDNEEVPIERIAYNLQALRVPAGVHELKFRFLPVYDRLLKAQILLLSFGWLLRLRWLKKGRLEGREVA